MSIIMSNMEKRGIKKSALILLLLLLLLVLAVWIFSFTHDGSPVLSPTEHDAHEYTEEALLEHKKLFSALVCEIYTGGGRAEMMEISKEINALLQSNYTVNNAYQEQIIAEALRRKISEIQAFLDAENLQNRK